jgi:RNA polymerase sigma-70 factor (ECF subfamily)
MHRQLLTSFLAAVQGGEMSTLTHLLSENVTLWADGGGKIKQAPLHPIRGNDAVARFSLGTRRFWPENVRVEIEEVNAQEALIIRAGEQVFSVLAIDVEEGRIQAIRIIANPEKLARI